MAKKKKDFDGDPGGLIGDAIFSAIKPLYKEGEKAKRTRRALRRTYYAPEPKVSQKEIIFSVLGRAIRNAGVYFSARDLYYATRPLAYAHRDWDNDKQLDYSYFSQTLLTDYQKWYGVIDGLWRDPRGHLHEPHGEVCETCGTLQRGTLALGTREVASYEFPEHTFDKILYVEKEGEWPKLQAARLAERYDMAVATSKGYPVEAVRELFSRAERGDYQLFVFHDADIDGYEIARVMREATERMPHHNVDVVDVGLTIEDAVNLGLDSEPYYRNKGIPGTLRWRLTELEREYFRGQAGERFELNAILPDTRRIEYIEEKLRENGARGKVLPAEAALPDQAEKIYRAEAEKWADAALEEILSWSGIKEKLAEEFKEHFELDAPSVRESIEKKFEDDRALSWRAALKKRFAELQEKHDDSLREAVREKVRKRFEDGEGASEVWTG